MGLLTDGELGGLRTVDYDCLNRRNHLPRKGFSAQTMLQVFPSVREAFAKGKVVPVQYLTETGLLCRCGAEVEIGRAEIVECPNECSRWFLRAAPDVIRCAKPESL